MGRHKKNIITCEGIDRRDSGYYSTPDFISKFMTDAMLDINPDGKFVSRFCGRCNCRIHNHFSFLYNSLNSFDSGASQSLSS